MQTKEEVLNDLYGYPAFRPGQAEIIDHITFSDQPTLVVMPTGGGKSIIYTIPSFMFEDTFTLVISPLISLMKDQVDGLKVKGMPVELYNSSLEESEKGVIRKLIFNSGCKMLFISPERFKDLDFIENLPPVDLFAIDEAHCISSWGEDFRPTYLTLGAAIEKLREKSPNLKVVALTATATPEVQTDICEKLNLKEAKIFIRGFNRDNLKLQVTKVSTKKAREDWLFRRLAHWEDGATGIIYAPTRKACEMLQEQILEILPTCYLYHAGMKDELRAENQNKWLKNGGAIVATTAFGMGINKPDVRYVYNFGHPGSVEDLYQMQGRAGRDGLMSDCEVFTFPSDDWRLQNWFIDASYPPKDVIDKVLYGIQVRKTSGSIYIDKYKLGKELEIGGLLDGALTTLEKYGILQKGRRWNTYDILIPSYQEAIEKIDWRDLKMKRDRRLSKLSSLVEFLNSPNCRMAEICFYFGSKDAVGVRCGNCDNCKREEDL